jgi:hypothetical protein
MLVILEGYISVLTCITSMVLVGAPLLDLSALCFCRLRGVIWRQWRVSEPHWSDIRIALLPRSLTKVGRPYS